MMDATRIPQRLVDALSARFGTWWRLSVHSRQITMRYRRPPARQPARRRCLSPRAMLSRIEYALGRQGVLAAPLLPLRWRRDTDVTISAVQALDPWLKDGADRVWREGYLPQPVVRFTGDRDETGRLRDGFLTSFVNVSCVQRIGSVHRHVELIDAWIGALSAVGAHASRITVHGDVDVWRRGPVEGITLFVDCDGIGIGDAVLLWHAADPGRMAVDLGAGLERLRWVISGRSWRQLVHGDLGGHADSDELDAVRTATLLLMAGIQPAARGAGAAVRRLARCIPQEHARLGLSRAVRLHHAYWTEIGVRGLAWPQVATPLEQAVLDHTGSSRT